jgi:hypothetical protein
MLELEFECIREDSTHAQSGFAILFTPKVTAAEPWRATETVVYRNVLGNSPHGFCISGGNRYGARFMSGVMIVTTIWTEYACRSSDCRTKPTPSP